jgi:Zn-finger nucleic acid-binding protein
MATDYVCPRCKSALLRVEHERGVSWDCPSCHGVAATIASLKQNTDPKRVGSAWATARVSERCSEQLCAMCRASMRSFTLKQADDVVELDACLRCHVLWFDGQELARLGITLASPTASGLGARELGMAKALLWAEAVKEERKAERTAGALWLLLDTITALLH